ncbi:hypothetical protein TP70_10105, partial [Staphylococcus microti]
MLVLLKMRRLTRMIENFYFQSGYGSGLNPLSSIMFGHASTLAYNHHRRWGLRFGLNLVHPTDKTK